VNRDVLILNPAIYILLNTYLNKIFLRVFFPEQYEMGYVKKLKAQIVEQELKALRKLKDLERKYQLESRRMEESVWRV